MTTWTLGEIEQAVRASWGVDTCDPVDAALWRSEHPSLGQCGVTALVLQDLLGGRLVLAEVHADGERIGHHWWNRFGDGIDVDLTRDQFRFRPGEPAPEARVVERPAGPPRRCREQYELLRDRVRARLLGGAAAPDVTR